MHEETKINYSPTGDQFFSYTKGFWTEKKKKPQVEKFDLIFKD